jgi:hypothetical protein
MLDSLSCSFTSISKKDMDVNEHERLSNITARKEQFVVRKHIDVNEHERLLTTLRHKLK